ncbi:hypothetical protein [Jatrophihabitans sp.]|uniref:hypothetical protein n=1 Tax=Jatrophihabitans sp. TaxID=1932789 RepID=UPI002B6820AB|nr:hypothetical protein [Jatrophihabitans sp.]
MFRGLFDDAALFPPGNAAMPAAVGGHAGYRQNWYSGLVARFVCPAGRLAELDRALAEFGREWSGPPEISMTVPGGPAELAGALATAEGLPELRLGVVELPVGAAELPGVLDELDDISEQGLAVFAEVPVAEVTEELAAALHAAGLGLKLRTGGTSAAAFPAGAELAAAIEAAIAGGVRFKCTAGLHNAVRHDDPATGFAHHGFLNVLLAVHSALAGGPPPAELLASDDGPALAERARTLAPDEVAGVRRRFASIGSCSIEESLTDLIELKLVTPA